MDAPRAHRFPFLGLAALALLLASLLAAPAQAATRTSGNAADGSSGTILQEGFEETTFPAQPDGMVSGTQYYTRTCYAGGSATGTAQVTTTSAATGTRSYLVDQTDASSGSFVCRFQLAAGNNICSIGGIAFAIKYSTSGGAWEVGIAESSGWNSPTTLPTYYAKVSANNGQGSAAITSVHVTSGSNSANVANPSGVVFSGSATPGTTSFAHFGFTCGAGQSTFINYDTSTTVLLAPSGVSPAFAPDTFYIWSGPGFSNGGPPIQVDDINFGKVAGPSVTGTSFAATAVSATYAAGVGIVGADVDSSGQTVILRRLATSTTTTIETLNALGNGAGTLNSIATATSDCDILDGVAAWSGQDAPFVNYLDCENATDTDVNAIRIRTPNLTAPTFLCDSCSDDDIEEDSTIAVPSAMRDMRTIASRPMDFSSYTTEGTNHGTAAWIFGEDLTNRVGLYAVTVNNNGDDKDSVSYKTLASGSTNAHNICSFSFDAGSGVNDYLLASNAGGKTAVYKSYVTLSGLGVEQPETHLDTVLESNTYGQAKAIACGNTDKVAILLGTGQLYLVDVIGGVPTEVWSSPITATASPRSIAMSGNGKFLTYRNGSNWEVVDLTNTTHPIKATFPHPTGSTVGVEMDYTGGNVWVIMFDKVYRYSIGSATCQTQCTITTDEGGNPLPGQKTNTPTSSSTTTCSFFCANGSTVPKGFSVGSFNALLGALMVAGVGGGFYFIDPNKRNSMLFASIGAIVGVFLAYFFGLFPLWLIIVLVILAVAVIFIRMRSGLA